MAEQLIVEHRATAARIGRRRSIERTPDTSLAGWNVEERDEDPPAPGSFMLLPTDIAPRMTRRGTDPPLGTPFYAVPLSF